MRRHPSQLVTRFLFAGAAQQFPQIGKNKPFRAYRRLVSHGFA
jgi:hypothetical protein